MHIPSIGSRRPVPSYGLDARLALRPVAGSRRTVVPLPADDPASARRARQAARSQMALWRVPEELADDLVLAVSELAANAVTHAVVRSGTWAGWLWVVLGRHPGAVLVAVVDNGCYDPRCFRPQRPDNTASGGRGLRIVEELSDRWGPQGASSGPPATGPPLRLHLNFRLPRPLPADVRRIRLRCDRRRRLVLPGVQSQRPMGLAAP
jgi:anti-sigma regulatory factor (Ser/Thr protein kinase)